MNLAKKHLSIVTFLIITLFLLITFIILGIKPFGDKYILLGDSYDQYIPILGLFKDKTAGIGSMSSVHDLFYTWKIGLGANYLLLFFYYLASPFNILLLFVSKSGLISAFTFIVILKVALAGASFSYYLRKKMATDIRYLLITAISVCYALSGFICGYFWNIMWLDSLIMFPIVMLGMDRLLEGKNPVLYIISLCITIYLNFYMAFMICIFLGIYFLFWKYDSVRSFLKTGVRFALASLLAAGMTAVSLCVIYFGIGETSGASYETPGFGFFGNILHIFKRAFFLSKPVVTERYNGVANIYCGCAFVLLVPVYFLFSKKDLNEKLRKAGMFLILVISMNESVLNYIWHGFHEQFLIPNRFSFIYIFLILCIGYEALSGVEQLSAEQQKKRMCLIAAAFIAVISPVVCYAFVEFDCIAGVEIVIVTNMLLIMIYAVLLGLAYFGSVKKTKVIAAFSVLMLLELFTNAFLSFESQNLKRDERAMEAMIDYYENSDSEEDLPFYREDVLDPEITNENTLIGMNGASTFCSTISGNSLYTMIDLGYKYMSNQYIFKGFIPLTNALISLKNYYYFDGENVSKIENEAFLPLGYVADKRLLDYSYSEEINPLYTLNSILKLSTDTEEDVITDINDEVGCFFDGCTIKKDAEGNNSIFIEEVTQEMAVVDLCFSATQEGVYYIYIAATGGNGVRVSIDGEEYAYGDIINGWLELPRLESGENVEAIFFTEEPEVSLLWYFGRYNDEVAENALNVLSEEHLEISSFSEGEIKGTLDMRDEGVMVLSIPFDDGWSVYDGDKKVSAVKVMRGFTGVPLGAGHHDIRIVYTPKGIIIGGLVMILSWIIFIVYLVIRRRFKEKNRRIKELS